MFVDLTTPERSDFLSQTYGSLIPGYTGHCPTLKFRFGRCYGANTKDIIKDLAVKGVVNAAYRDPEPSRRILGLNYPEPDEPARYRDPVPSVTRGRYIHGYTGYVPGMNFSYGRSYCPLAEENYAKFLSRVTQSRVTSRVEPALKLTARLHEARTPVRSREGVTKALKEYHEQHKYREEHISPEHPPIAGYTGHLPRVKSGGASLSQRYHNAAKTALLMLREERELRGR